MTPILIQRLPFKCIKNKFTLYEDTVIRTLVHQLGDNPNWDLIASIVKTRTARQCKDRWNCYLDPQVNLSEWSAEEDDLLTEKVNSYGQRWKFLAQFFNRRSETNLKNRYKLLKRREEKRAKEVAPHNARKQTARTRVAEPVAASTAPRHEGSDVVLAGDSPDIDSPGDVFQKDYNFMFSATSNYAPFEFNEYGYDFEW